MEHGQQEVKPGISLGRTWSKFQDVLSRRDRFHRPYDNHQRLKSPQAVQTPGGEVKAIEEQLTQTEHTQITTGSQGAGKISSPVASHNSETNRSVAKSHHSSHSQEVSRRKQGHKGKNKTSFPQRQRESDPMI
ncbi:hypothetical protein O181_040813 [Austropuccinia psidii MF-1]|uniref:Uncharacterized protein n=1 Tax=Austropuccinia psidii MF-1 TaxID=1389203 RepID=A0A9Q3HD88_9BASI|nr:hypothetical protein [Austropuccinia psidii MF-1]